MKINLEEPKLPYGLKENHLVKSKHSFSSCRINYKTTDQQMFSQRLFAQDPGVSPCHPIRKAVKYHGKTAGLRIRGVRFCFFKPQFPHLTQATSR